MTDHHLNFVSFTGNKLYMHMMPCGCRTVTKHAEFCEWNMIKSKLFYDCIHRQPDNPLMSWFWLGRFIDLKMDWTRVGLQALFRVTLHLSVGLYTTGNSSHHSFHICTDWSIIRREIIIDSTVSCSVHFFSSLYYSSSHSYMPPAGLLGYSAVMVKGGGVGVVVVVVSGPRITYHWILDTHPIPPPLHLILYNCTWERIRKSLVYKLQPRSSDLHLIEGICLFLLVTRALHQQ